jgi:hypothetical protein
VRNNLITRPGPTQGPIKMKQRFEQMALIAIAIVSGVAPFTNMPAVTGLALAALNLGLAFFVRLR